MSPANIETTSDKMSTAHVAPVNPPLADNISGQLVGIQDSLKKLTDAITNCPSWPSASSAGRASKRRREERVDDDDSGEPAAAVIPVAPTANSVVVGSADEDNDLLVVEPRKLLVASLFHPSTEADHLATFLKGKLNIATESNEVRIFKLVAAGKDLSTLDYVSFKIDVPRNRFNELLSPLIWPRRVRVREFEHRPRKSRGNAVFLIPPTATDPDRTKEST